MKKVEERIKLLLREYYSISTALEKEGGEEAEYARGRYSAYRDALCIIQEELQKN